MHRGTCGSIGSEKIGNWTGRHYYKVVADSQDTLTGWLSANWSGAIRHCGLCTRTGGKTVSRPATVRKSLIAENSRKSLSNESPTHGTAVLQVSELTKPWKLWAFGPSLKLLEGVDPQIDSWDHNAHPNQVRLKAYLDVIKDRFAPVLTGPGPFAIRLTVDLKRESRLYRGNDVDNYLIPLFKALDWRRFVHAQVEKCVGRGSRIEVGRASLSGNAPGAHGWSGRIDGNLKSEMGKRSIRLGLQSAVDAPLPAGPVAVEMAWRLASSRNWVELWKPTGDAMGPVVGASRYPRREFHPDDDRITKLTLHRCTDDTLERRMVDVGLWWSLVDEV
jgi:hypothetical protein